MTKQNPSEPPIHLGNTTSRIPRRVVIDDLMAPHSLLIGEPMSGRSNPLLTLDWIKRTYRTAAPHRSETTQQ